MSKALRICHGAFGRVALLNLDRPLVTHVHAEPHLLLKLGGVDTVFRVRGAALPLAHDRAVNVRPWEPHDFPHGRLPDRALVLALYLDSTWLRDLGSNGPLPTSLVLGAQAQACAAEIGAALMEEGGPSCAAVVAARLQTLLSLLLPSDRPTAQAPAVRIDRRLQRVIDALDQRFGDAVDFAALASEAGLSRAHLFALFRRELQLTPAVYLNARRMSHALEVIRLTRRPIGELALDLGFSAQSNFTRFFRDIQGVAPNEYRSASRVIEQAALETGGQGLTTD